MAFTPTLRSRNRSGRKSDRITTARSEHYYVSIGTQAAKWLEDRIRHDQTNAPHVFLGVTDPYRESLIEVAPGTHTRRGTRRIWGVQYGEGAKRMVELTRIVFRTDALFFPFNGVDYPQDKDFAADMPADVKPFEVRSNFTRNDLPAVGGIYLSWYTLEERFAKSDPESISLLAERRIVTSTESHVKNGLAAVGIGADDVEIGRQGADYVAKLAQRGNARMATDLIIVQPLALFVNCKRASATGVHIDASILANATNLYDCKGELQTSLPTQGPATGSGSATPPP